MLVRVRDTHNDGSVDDFADNQMTVTPASALVVGRGLVLVVFTGRSTDSIVDAITGGVAAGISGWTLIHRQTGVDNGGNIELWAAICDTASSTVVVHMSLDNALGGDRCALLEYTGAASPFVESGTSSGNQNLTGPSTHTAATVTPTHADNVFIAVVTADNGWSNLTAGFTAIVNTQFHLIAEKIQTTATASDFSADTAVGENHLILLGAMAGDAGVPAIMSVSTKKTLRPAVFSPGLAR